MLSVSPDDDKKDVDYVPPGSLFPTEDIEKDKDRTEEID